MYHVIFLVASRILQVLDHVGIYMLIAGSYTPYLLIALPSSTAARVLVSAEWIFALFGSIFAGTYAIINTFLNNL